MTEDLNLSATLRESVWPFKRICRAVFLINELQEHTQQRHEETNSTQWRSITNNWRVSLLYLHCLCSYTPRYFTLALLPDSCLLQSLFLLPAYFGMSTPPSISAGGNPSYGTLLQNDFISMRKWETKGRSSGRGGGEIEAPIWLAVAWRTIWD